jgi:ribose transport system ATP-binding protein
MGETVVSVKNIVKTFGPVRALSGVSLDVKAGEIAGLIGENGSGKSTVTSIIAGMQGFDSGEMSLLGPDGRMQNWKPASMVEAARPNGTNRGGVGMILQEANTIPGCTVAENIFAGRLDEFSRAGVLNEKKMNAAAAELLEKFNVKNVKADALIDRYGFEERKLVEIVRALAAEPELFIVDETSTALSLDGRALLYKFMDKLRDEGKAVIFISHDIDEVIARCTNLIVLRDGQITGHFSREQLDEPDVAKQIRFYMVGRDIGEAYYREDYDSSCGKETELEIKDAFFGALKNFNLTLHRGEIVGIGGLSGCGMHEAGRAAFGLEKLRGGSVTRNGKKITSPQKAIKEGIGYISKNRDTEALILMGSIAENIELPSLPFMTNAGFISPQKEKNMVNGEIKRFAIKCTGGRQWVGTLSGGNKQKVSFAKWTAKGCDVFIMDCPTRGVDVGVKQSMYAFIAEMKKQGKAVIIISEELPELIGMSDRIIIMKDFKITREFKRSPALKETDVIEYMI